MSQLIKKTPDKERLPSVDIDTIKSVYYWLNAKPDTDIRVLDKYKEITFEKLKNLNEKIQDKIKNHDVVGSIVAIEIIFKDKRAKTYGSWDEFIRSDWNIDSIIDNVNIKWDISVKLPHYHLPQRHTLKLRFKSELKPSEYFELLYNNTGDLEKLESEAFLVCTTDFINAILSNELLNIVEEWYKTLIECEYKGFFQRVIENNKVFLAQTMEVLIYIIIFSIYYAILKYFGLNTMNDLVIIITLAFIVFKLSEIIGEYFGKLTWNKIKKLESPSIFLITSGDKNEKMKREERNSSLSFQILTQLILTSFGAILGIFLEKIINLTF